MLMNSDDLDLVLQINFIVDFTKICEKLHCEAWKHTSSRASYDESYDEISKSVS